LEGLNEFGVFDPYTVTPNSRFSVGYNDWGFGNALDLKSPSAALGLGGDIDGGDTRTNERLRDRVAVQMIMVADSRALNRAQWFLGSQPGPDRYRAGWRWAIAIQPPQLQNRIAILRRSLGAAPPDDVIVRPQQPVANAMDNDNQPHLECKWTTLSIAIRPIQLDPSY